MTKCIAVLVLAAMAGPAWAQNDARVIAGFEQSAAASAAPVQKVFADLYFTQALSSRMRVWGDLRLSSMPQQINSTAVSVVVDVTKAVTTMPLNRVARSGEFLVGTETRVLGRAQTTSLSMIASYGASAPLNLDPQRGRFFRQYYGGGREDVAPAPRVVTLAVFLKGSSCGCPNPRPTCPVKSAPLTKSRSPERLHSGPAPPHPNSSQRSTGDGNAGVNQRAETVEQRVWLRKPVVTGITLRRPLVAALALALLVALGALGTRWYIRSSRVHWAETQAIPQAAQLMERSQPLAVLKLLQQAAPSSTELIRLKEDLRVLPATIETTPAAAEIYGTDYADPKAADFSQWEHLGRSPLKTDRLPIRGYYRIRSRTDQSRWSPRY